MAKIQSTEINYLKTQFYEKLAKSDDSLNQKQKKDNDKSKIEFISIEL